MGFYCQKVCGDINFSIKEWNEKFKFYNDLDMEMPPEDHTQCENQCDSCINIVLDTQEKRRLRISGTI